MPASSSAPLAKSASARLPYDCTTTSLGCCIPRIICPDQGENERERSRQRVALLTLSFLEMGQFPISRLVGTDSLCRTFGLLRGCRRFGQIHKGSRNFMSPKRPKSVIPDCAGVLTRMEMHVRF